MSSSFFRRSLRRLMVFFSTGRKKALFVPRRPDPIPPKWRSAGAGQQGRLKTARTGPSGRV
jgi:hypothetical protein